MHRLQSWKESPVYGSVLQEYKDETRFKGPINPLGQCTSVMLRQRRSELKCCHYEGDLRLGAPHGEGFMAYHSAKSAGHCSYTGSFSQGERCGHGTYIIIDKGQTLLSIMGTWDRDLLHDSAIITTSTYLFEGTFSSGVLSGDATATFYLCPYSYALLPFPQAGNSSLKVRATFDPSLSTLLSLS